jgi:hypothetical protein
MASRKRRPGVVAPTTTCNAKTRGGSLCRLKAGQRTDHPGVGRCWLHGGRVPVKHGRYSSIPRARLGEVLAQLEAETEAEQLNILPEAQPIRALAANYIEHYEELVDALIAWNDDEAAAAHIGNRKPRPQRIPSLHEAASLLDRASQVIDRIHRQRSDNAISRADLMRVMQEMGRVVQRHVTDGATLDKIKDDWLAIRVA